MPLCKVICCLQEEIETSESQSLSFQSRTSQQNHIQGRRKAGEKSVVETQVIAQRYTQQ